MQDKERKERELKERNQRDKELQELQEFANHSRSPPQERSTSPIIKFKEKALEKPSNFLDLLNISSDEYDLSSISSFSLTKKQYELSQKNSPEKEKNDEKPKKKSKEKLNAYDRLASTSSDETDSDSESAPTNVSNGQKDNTNPLIDSDKDKHSQNYEFLSDSSNSNGKKIEISDKKINNDPQQLELLNSSYSDFDDTHLNRLKKNSSEQSKSSEEDHRKNKVHDSSDIKVIIDDKLN